MKTFDFSGFENASLSAARKYLRATGADIRKSVKTSLKSGGRVGSKTFRSSQPGEPPRTHGRRLKQSIRYDVDGDALKVGAPSLQGGATAATLEKGGVGKIVETTVDAAYFSRRKRRARVDPKKTARPAASRAYTLKSDDGSTRRVAKYERFSDKNRAQRASSAPDFNSWRERVQKTKRTTPEIAPRPFVAPAAKRETATETARERWARIVRAGVRNRARGE